MKIYHNPRCRKSREAVQYLTEKDVLFEIVEYTFSNATLVNSNVCVKSIICIESLFPKMYFFIFGFHLNVLWPR